GNDSNERVRGHFLVVWPRSGRCRRGAFIAAACAKAWRSAVFDATTTIEARLYAAGDAELADLLGYVCDVRSGRSRRSDWDGPAGPDRQRLPDRQGSRVSARDFPAGADFCPVDRPRVEWVDTTVLRLGVGSHRSREHDVYRVRAGGSGDLVAQRLWS